ncbi:hypothetical protein Q8G46_27965, partial [Klebsiella pneumoniae]|uniref:hypothetical protein n=1 Tax=Klebsiella pneumoniae TaxID=573 RepID=UPI003013CAF4
ANYQQVASLGHKKSSTSIEASCNSFTSPGCKLQVNYNFNHLPFLSNYLFSDPISFHTIP